MKHVIVSIVIWTHEQNNKYNQKLIKLKIITKNFCPDYPTNSTPQDNGPRHSYNKWSVQYGSIDGFVN